MNAPSVFEWTESAIWNTSVEQTLTRQLRSLEVASPRISPHGARWLGDVVFPRTVPVRGEWDGTVVRGEWDGFRVRGGLNVREVRDLRRWPHVLRGLQQGFFWLAESGGKTILAQLVNFLVDLIDDRLGIYQGLFGWDTGGALRLTPTVRQKSNCSELRLDVGHIVGGIVGKRGLNCSAPGYCEFKLGVVVADPCFKFGSEFGVEMGWVDGAIMQNRNISMTTERSHQNQHLFVAKNWPVRKFEGLVFLSLSSLISCQAVFREMSRPYIHRLIIGPKKTNQSGNA